MKCKLSDISIITMGQSPKSSSYNKIQNGLPFLQGSTTFGDTYPYFDIWTSDWNKEANIGDILFSVRAPVGQLNIANTKIAIGRGIASIKPTKVPTKYLFYLLITNRNKFLRSSTGTIFESINKDVLFSIQLNIHTDNERNHIVNTIGSVDDLIENYQNQVKEILKVGDFLITKSSISEPLTKYADIYLGSTPSRSKPEFWNGNIKWINSGALTDKPAVTEPTEHITSLGIKTSATKPGNKGNTVLSIIEPNINKIAVLLDNNIYFNQSIICLAAKESKHHGLIYFASRKLIYKIKRYATGAAQQSLNKQMFEESKIYVTNKIIIKQLNLLLNKLLKLEEKIRILKQIKQQLLNKYF